uniref:Uncharacterized protein n=1 Tax=Physcomitrium patens TaxID=3218 RepID=A0A2K1IN69_PHYPA|nr:hypothetical protein PHYPA_027033 [Physcomitrium patens]
MGVIPGSIHIALTPQGIIYLPFFLDWVSSSSSPSACHSFLLLVEVEVEVGVRFFLKREINEEK